MINVQFSKTLAEVLGSSRKSRRVYSDLRSHRGVTFLNQGQARPQENYNHNISLLTMFTTQGCKYKPTQFLHLKSFFVYLVSSVKAFLKHCNQNKMQKK